MTISDDERTFFAGLGERGPVPLVQRQLERISQLPKPKQRAVMDVIEALLG